MGKVGKNWSGGEGGEETVLRLYSMKKESMFKKREVNTQKEKEKRNSSQATVFEQQQ